MRVYFTNTTGSEDAHLHALADYAASFFPHRTGKVYLAVKRGKRSHGVCIGRSHCTVWLAKPGAVAYPKTFEQMHYFRHANHDEVKTLTCNDWWERALSIIAHEFEHTTKGNCKMRRSQQEIHAWNRSVEVVEASRTREGQTDIAARFTEYVAAEAACANRVATKKTPEFKLQRIIELQIKWQRKLKLAQTKLRKLKVRAKYFEKKAAANVAAQNVGG